MVSASHTPSKPCATVVSDWPGPGSAELRAVAENNREDAAVDRRTAWEASPCHDSPRLHQQSHSGICQRCCAGFSGLPQKLDHSPHSTELGHWTSSHQCGCAEAARIAWGGNRYKLARSAMREQGRSKTGFPSLPHVKLSPMSAPGPTGERQERLFEETLVGCHCLAASCSIRSSMTTSGSDRWRKRKKPRPTSQKIASCMISKTLTPRKFGPSRWESSCGNTSRGDFWHSAREILQPSRHRCGRSGLVPRRRRGLGHLSSAAPR